MTSRWLVVLLGIVSSSFLASAALAATSSASNTNPHIQFIQQDVVGNFDLTTGTDFQIGTATGDINGTTFVEFQFVPAGPRNGDTLPITFSNKVIITDIDGDQLFFDNKGSGTLHLGVPGSNFRGPGGPLTGTYVLTGGTGKYSPWTTGSTYIYRAIATNPSSPPSGLGAAIYVEVSGPTR